MLKYFPIRLVVHTYLHSAVVNGKYGRNYFLFGGAVIMLCLNA